MDTYLLNLNFCSIYKALYSNKALIPKDRKIKKSEKHKDFHQISLSLTLTLLDSKVSPFSFRHQMSFWYHFGQIFWKHHMTVFELLVRVFVGVINLFLWRHFWKSKYVAKYIVGKYLQKSTQFTRFPKNLTHLRPLICNISLSTPNGYGLKR